MRSSERLALALEQAGLTEMAKRAREFYYDDFKSELDLPSIQLANDLKAAGTEEAMALLMRHYNGEFDATAKESEEWCLTEEGQQAIKEFGELPRGKLKG